LTGACPRDGLPRTTGGFGGGTSGRRAGAS
jgi:hypothetical protein